MTPEGRVKAKVNKVLKALGPDCHCFKPVQTGFGSVGLDYHLCVRGLAVYIETKKPGGKLTPLQQITRKTMLEAGALVLVVKTDDDITTLTEVLSGITYHYHRLTERAKLLYYKHLRSCEADIASCSGAGVPTRKPRAARRAAASDNGSGA